MIFLLQAGLLLALALILGRLAQLLKMPAVAGELCAGIVVGPSILAHVSPAAYDWLVPHDPAQAHLLDAAGQLGVLLLVGVTGLSMDLGLVRRRGRTAATVSACGLIVPFGLGVVTGLLVPAMLVPHPGARLPFVLFIGVAMGVSAIPVIAKTLTDLRLLHRNIGQLIVGSAVVDDIAGWIMLSIVSALVTTGMSGQGIAKSMILLVSVFVLAFLARPAVRRLFALANRSTEAGPTVAVTTVLILLASAFTQAVNLEAVFGAFVAGVMIGNSGTLDRTKLNPLRVAVMWVLAPLYFATAGLRIDLTALGRPTVLATGVAVVVVAIVGKFSGAYAGGRLAGLDHWESLAIGAGMNARGVIEVIIAMVGLRLGVLSTEIYTIIVLVAVATSFMAGPLLRKIMMRVEQTSEEHTRELMTYHA
jgi:Kef-type K+ transport system membrane component KefB